MLTALAIGGTLPRIDEDSRCAPPLPAATGVTRFKRRQYVLHLFANSFFFCKDDGAVRRTDAGMARIRRSRDSIRNDTLEPDPGCPPGGDVPQRTRGNLPGLPRAGTRLCASPRLLAGGRRGPDPGLLRPFPRAALGCRTRPDARPLPRVPAAGHQALPHHGR